MSRRLVPTVRRLLPVRSTAAIAAFAALVAPAAGIGIAGAAIPSSDGTISACHAKVGGARYLRPIDQQAGEACKGSEKLLTWNQKGPTGSVKARSVAADVAAGEQRQIDALCLPGERAVGGGFLLDSPKVRVIADATDLDLTKWAVEVVNESGETQLVIAQAICANPK